MQPKLVKENKLHGDTYQHPAFGQITVSRVSGSMNLYGSELQHRGFVSIRIHTSELVRNLHQDWHHPREAFVEVALSEHQWAAFVSSFQSGSGVPCTIRSGPKDLSNWERKPEITLMNKHEMAQKELKDSAKDLTERMEKGLAALSALAEGKGAVSKTEFKTILKDLGLATGAVVHNLPFHVEQHKEMMENHVQAARSEVEGMLSHVVRQAGLEHLQSSIPQLSVDKKD